MSLTGALNRQVLTARDVVARVAGIVPPVLLLAIFTRTFDPSVNRWLVNFTWLAALLMWAYGIWRSDPARRWRIDRKYVWPFLIFAALFATAWLPFYDNWRWVQAGDSYPHFWLPRNAAIRGLSQSILSMHGVDEHFPYTAGIVDNFLMFIFGPTLFWHRASKCLMSVLALLSIYTFFSLVLEFPWALAIVVVTSATFHWQNFSHISYIHIDSFISAYLALAALTLIFRDPHRQRRWLALGVVAGLSLFFTQTAWAEVTAAGVIVTAWGLSRRQFKSVAICGISFLIAATPALLQFPALFKSATVQAGMVWDWNYFRDIFHRILWLPCGSSWSTVEWNGYFAGWPCGYFYGAGLLLSALSVVPPIRRRLWLPPAAVGLLLLFLAEAVTMTLTNNGHSLPSAKRTYHLIPLQAFFSVLPFYSLALIVRRSRLAYRGVMLLAAVAVGAYTVACASLFVYPERFKFGGNIFDGLVQMRQRFPDRKVLLFTRNAGIKSAVEDPMATMNQEYHVADTVSATGTIDPAMVATACDTQTILCIVPQPEDRAELTRAAASHELRRVDVFAVGELQCFECSDSGPIR